MLSFLPVTASSTAIPARQLGRHDEIGFIETGKLADFVVCDEKL